MKTRMLAGCTLLVLGLFVVVAHAQETAYENVVKGMLTTLDDINKALSGVKDEATAVATRPDLKKQGERMLELRKKAKDLPQPEQPEKDRLERIYKGQFEESLKKLRQESLRVKTIPGGDEALKEIAVLEEKKQPKEKRPCSRRAGPAFVLAALLGLAGCGTNEEEEYKTQSDLHAQQIALMDEVSDILASIKAPDQMEVARPELMKRYERIDALASKFQKQGKMSEAVAARIERSFGNRIVATSTRFRKQGAEILKLPGGEEFLRSLKPMN